MTINTKPLHENVTRPNINYNSPVFMDCNHNNNNPANMQLCAYQINLQTMHRVVCYNVSIPKLDLLGGFGYVPKRIMIHIFDYLPINVVVRSMLVQFNLSIQAVLCALRMCNTGRFC